MELKNCKWCQERISVNDYYCPYCKKNTNIDYTYESNSCDETKICKECGVELRKNANYCHKCGNEIYDKIKAKKEISKDISLMNGLSLAKDLLRYFFALFIVYLIYKIIMFIGVNFEKIK